ncbi:unnamed protein product [Camellia sinensis]
MDGVALPTTQMTLRFGGEDISRCLLWTQRHHQTWPPIRTDALTKPVDLLMLNRLKEMYCQIKMFNDYEDMLADTWHMEFPRRSDMSNGLYSSVNGGFPMWDSYSFFQTKPKKEDCIGLAEAITKSILSTGLW